MTGKDEMAGAFLIRPMRGDDVVRVQEIAGRLKNIPHWPLSAYLSALDPHVLPRRVALVATDAAKDFAIGYVIASLIVPQAELENIGVAHDRQRLGLGKALIERLFGELELEGIREVWLEVRVSNEAALRLYRRTGFRERGRRKGYYADPVEDAIVMYLTIR